MAQLKTARSIAMVAAVVVGGPSCQRSEYVLLSEVTDGRPMVNAVLPPDGAEGVLVDAIVEVLFSEPTDPATVTAASLSVEGVTGRFDVEGSSVKLLPFADLAYATTYTGKISDTILDEDGLPLLDDVTWSFTTRPRGDWAGVGNSAMAGGISNQDGVTVDKRVVVGPDDIPYVTWGNEGLGTADVFLAHAVGSSWVGLAGSANAGGVSGDAGESSHATVAFDAAGTPYVAWQDTTGPDDRVYVKRWSRDLDAWEVAPGSTSGLSTSTSASWPRAITDTMGRVIVAWTESNGVYLKRFAEEMWTQLEGSASGTGVSGQAATGSQFVSLAASAGEDIYVAWNDVRTGHDEIYLAWWDGESWGELDGSATGSGVSQSPALSSWFGQVHADSAGRPVVCWMEVVGEHQHPLVKRWDGSSWVPFGSHTSLVAANAAPGQTYHPSCAITRRGRPIVVWEEEDMTGARNIYGARWDGVTWVELGASEPTSSISASAVDSSWPSVAVDSQGVVYVAWEERVSPTTSEVYLKRYW